MYFPSDDNDDDLYLDNLDEQDEQDDEGEGDEEPPQRKGNLSVALQEERKQRRELQEQLKARDSELQRLNGFLERTTPQPKQEFDREEANRRLQEELIERPFDVLESMLSGRDREWESKITKAMAPALVTHTDAYLSSHPEYKDLYASPVVKQVIKSYAEDAVKSGNIKDISALEQALGNIMLTVENLHKDFTGGTSGKPDTRKEKLSSVAGKSGYRGDRGSLESVWEDKQKLAKSNPRKYSEWAKTDDGKKVLNAILRQGY